MNTKLYASLLAIALIFLVQIEGKRARDKKTQSSTEAAAPSILSSSSVATIFNKIRGVDPKATTKLESTKTINDNDLEEDESEEEEEEGGEDEGEEEEDEDEEDDDDIEEKSATALQPRLKKAGARAWTDMFGNQLKMDEDRTTIVLQNKARDLGLLTIKAIILGPLIGLTIKAALIRGLLWAVGAYFLHLFFPAILSTLGLGTGLVGFARQMQPDFAQMILPHLANFTMCAIDRQLGAAYPTSVKQDSIFAPKSTP